MSKKNFSAKSWFISNEESQVKVPVDSTHQSKSIESILAPFYHGADEENSPKTLSKYFIPGWKGESLLAKHVNEFSKILDQIKNDAKNTIKAKDELSRKLKLGLYNEFLAYAEYKNFNCTGLDHYTTFWRELKKSDSIYGEILTDFIDILSFRISVIYTLKVRFIITLKSQFKSNIELKDILNPNATITKEFRPGSSFELKAQAFEQNIFSWYRPDSNLEKTLNHFIKICPELNITEIVKTISTKSEVLLNNQSTDYSHSLSHKSFGLFINSMLINFPTWLNNQKKKTPYAYKALNNEIEIISCKFAGDYLESLSLSHWLAQDANKQLKWEQVLCPDFKGFDYTSGSYLKVINQIQFLTFLTQIANTQGKEPRLFVSQIISSHLYNRKNTNEIQRNFLNDSALSHSTYDRIILNLNEIPKNNPQHYIFNQISNQKQYLKDNGLLYLISSKKIFVPSQKNKIAALLKEFKVESIVSLTNIHGKGEIGSYIYILTKLPEYAPQNSEKQSCYRFRFHGELETFQEFSQITKLIQLFFQENLNETPPLYHKSHNQFRFEFFQDAIVDGKLFLSANKDSSQVTHPNYFNKLMSVCHPFDFYFELQNVDFNNPDRNSSDTLFDFSQSFSRDEAEYTIIVDQRKKDSVNLEIIPTKSLEAKAYEYGHILCSYYSLYPKWNGISINTFKEFFLSSIGKQLISLTFHNEHTKVKANLNKLLVPNFLKQENELPAHFTDALSIFDISIEQLFETHPTQITKRYQDISQFIDSLIQKYPGEILNKLANFKRVLQRSIERVGINGSTINFNNPVLKTPLLLSKTFSIYPDNEDIYTEFSADSVNLIHQKLTHTKRKVVTKEEYKTFGLTLCHGENEIATLYSDEVMVQFLEFLISNISEVPVSQILQGIQVPRLEDLKSIISSYKLMKRNLSDLYTQVDQDFNTALNKAIFQRS